MSAAELIQPGTISHMLTASADDPPVTNVVLQVVNIKKVPSKNEGGGNDRYRLVLSDTEHCAQSMLAVPLNFLAEESSLRKGTIIRLTDHARQIVSDRTIIIILRVDVLDQPGDKIGNPVPWAPAPAAAPANQSAPAQAAAPSTSANPYNNRGGAANNARGPARQNNRNGGPAGTNPIYPIEGLSPYQNKWTIKARVTAKSDIRHWSNAKGDGKLFNVTLIDETGEIRATGFGDTVDRLYPVFEEGKVYYVSKARINIAKKQFSNVNNEYEIALQNDTEVEPCLDTDNVPQLKLDIKSLALLEQMQKDDTCDVIGVVKDVGEINSITTKAGKTLPKREITLVDTSNYAVKLTLWARQAETFEIAPGDGTIVAFKGVRVSDFGGRTLSMVSSSNMVVNPDIEAGHALRAWYDQNGGNAEFTTYSSGNSGGGGSGAMKETEFRTIQQIKDEQLGTGERTDFFNIRGHVAYIKDKNMSYPSCPGSQEKPNCQKKVSMVDDGWRCESCDRSFPGPRHRYILSFCIADHTGQAWFSAFNDAGQLLLDASADEMDQNSADTPWTGRKMYEALFKMYNFSIKAKSDSYNDTMKVRYQVNRAIPLNYADETQKLMRQIQAFSN